MLKLVWKQLKQCIFKSFKSWSLCVHVHVGWFTNRGRGFIGISRETSSRYFVPPPHKNPTFWLCLEVLLCKDDSCLFNYDTT